MDKNAIVLIEYQDDDGATVRYQYEMTKDDAISVKNSAVALVVAEASADAAAAEAAQAE